MHWAILGELRCSTDQLIDCHVWVEQKSAAPAGEVHHEHAANASVGEAAVVIRTGGKAGANSAAADKTISSQKSWTAYASKNGAGAAGQRRGAFAEENSGCPIKSIHTALKQRTSPS